MGAPEGLGISLSGGGLRAASFGLGCLQQLDASKGVLSGPDTARYLAAVSGGSYTAAAVCRALADDASEDAPPLAADSAAAARIAERSDYFLRNGWRALLWRVLVIILSGALGLASIVLFLPSVAVLLASSWGLPDDGALVAALGAIGVAFAGGVTIWIVRYRPPEHRRWWSDVGFVLGCLLLVGTLPFAARLVDRIEPLSSPAWFIARWPAVLVAVLSGIAAAFLVQRRRRDERTFMTDRRRLGGAALAVALWGTYALAVLAPMWATALLLDAPGVAFAVLIVAGWMFFYAMSDATSFHAFYTERVASCFGPDVPVSSLRPDGGRPSPELLICAAANIKPPSSTVASFVVSPFEVRLYAPGGTASIPTPDYEKFLYPDGMRSDATRPALSLFRAVGLSGAAVSPSMGHMTVRAARGLLALSNLRIGRWMPNPASASTRDLAKRDGAQPLRLGAEYALRELWGHHPADGDRVYVTDGGHFENLGIVELLRRRCALIVAVNSSGDPLGPPRSLLHSIEVSKDELDIDISLDVESLERIATVGRTIRRCWTVGTVDYGDGARGTIVVIQIGADADTPADVLQSGRGIPRFPHTPTANQLFDAHTFEAYTALGRASVATALRAPEVAQAFAAWRRSCDSVGR